jgi:predicted ATP-dependent endonuclease of OLD family
MSKVAIFCEGSTDVIFLKEFITHLGFRKDDVRPYIMQGKPHFFEEDHKYYADVKSRLEIDAIKKVLFVMDADTIDKNNPNHDGFENTEIKLKYLIVQLGFQSISDYCIMCNPETQSGYLESLILSTIDEQTRHCIERFLECSQIASKEDHKDIVHKIYNKLYPNEPYNFDHENFNDLKTKLENLFK